MEDTNDRYAERLLKQHVKPTSTRILLLKAILQRKTVFRLADMEADLQTIDKSTIFRTLILFRKRCIVHTIDDGSGSLKYSVCDEGCHCSIEQLHVHFYCKKCKKVFCFRETRIPPVELPDGFLPDSINYVLKGLCSGCKRV
ncbi:MAG: transcriptional repressor [Tannerellaceae bacterium]|jgi:Fur family ferric uptake transcriptional regulator|nr:transcriptional repressor [Tannerellaceae bacterium]